MLLTAIRLAFSTVLKSTFRAQRSNLIFVQRDHSHGHDGYTDRSHAAVGLLTAPQAASETCDRRLQRGQETHADQDAFVLLLTRGSGVSLACQAAQRLHGSLRLRAVLDRSIALGKIGKGLLQLFLVQIERENPANL